MMITKTFIYKEWEDAGLWGWIEPEKADVFDPATGMGVAHDTIEHVGNHHNPTVDEIMAFGAIVAFRVRGEYWVVHEHKYVITDPVHHVGGSFNQVFEGFYGDGCDDIDGDIPFIEPQPKVDEEGEMWIDCVLEKGMALEETKEAFYYANLIEEGEEIPEMYFNLVRDWMRRGYRLAIEKYGDRPYEVNDAFKIISDGADHAMKFLEDGVDEGRELVVTLDTETLEASVDLQDPPWEDSDEYEDIEEAA